MAEKKPRASNLELLRILCMLLIIGDHLTGQGGIADYGSYASSFAFCLIGCGSRIGCSVFILIGGWFLCEQPFRTRRLLSLWLSLWLYTVPVTLLCALGGLPGTGSCGSYQIIWCCCSVRRCSTGCWQACPGRAIGACWRCWRCR